MTPRRRILFSGSRVDSQAQAAYNSLIAAGFTVPQGLLGINSAFIAVKAIYGVTDITTAVSFFADPSLAYEIGAGSGTTAGQAIRTFPNLVDSTRASDAVQTTAASQPLLLVHSGVNYWFGSGVSGNYISTPDSLANQIIGNIEYIGRVSTDWSSTSVSRIFLSKRNGTGNASYQFFFNGLTKRVSFTYYNGTTNITVDSTSGFGLADFAKVWIKITRNSTSGDVNFWTSTQDVSSPNDIIWNQLGTTVSSTIVGLINQAVSVEIGSINSGGNGMIVGSIYYSSISPTIGGSPTVVFNPSSYNAATSQTQWTSSTGEVWTINKSSGNTFTGVLVDRNIIQGNGTTTSMSCTITGTQPFTEYIVAAKNGTGNYVSRATGNSRSHSGTNVVLNNGTALNYASTSTLRQTLTFRNNGSSSGIALNNGTETTGNSGTNNGTTLVIGEGAHNITTLLVSKTNDSTPQRLAAYTYLRSINLY
jgi:hypothetical protein